MKPRHPRRPADDARQHARAWGQPVAEGWASQVAFRHGTELRAEERDRQHGPRRSWFESHLNVK